MPRTIRVYWGRYQGRVALNFNWGAIGRTSAVLVTVAEWHLDARGVQAGDRDYTRFVGDATIRVANIAPHGPPSDPNNGVTFVVEVDYDEPLPIVTDITVLDESPVEVIHLENASDT